MKAILFLALTCAILTVVRGVPLERKFKYQEDIHYVYTYSVNVSTNLGYHQTSLHHLGNDSNLYIDATLSVHFSSPCEGSLKVLNASISHDRSTYNVEFPDRAGYEFKTSLERFTLRFTFDDGIIHELCPDQREPVWALNLKRGMLSMLQNSMRRFDVDHDVNEVDIYGACDTEYRLYEAKRTSLIVKKSKNLADCQNGPKYFSVVQSNPYRTPRKLHEQHGLFTSRSDCEITIDHNIYERVVCDEVRLLQPLSNGDKAGGRTDSRVILQLIQETRETDFFQESEENDSEEKDKDNFIQDASHKKRTTLLYDHAKTLKTMQGELRTSRDLLKSMCRLANTDELQQRFSEIFTNFIRSARFLDYPLLSQLFSRANNICKIGKKHIIAALPYLNSNAAVNVMKDLIVKKYVDQATINDWIITFALFPRPDRETIKGISQLLDFEHQISDVQFSLSYSTIIHTYCKNHDNCIDLKEVDAFLSHLQRKISQGCAPRLHSPLVTKETLEALKAIGNMGLETKNLQRDLKKCIDDNGGFLPMEVRIAAIDAHRRLPSCEETRDEFFLDYYRNTTLDTEIRIASYLQVMHCPDYNVIKTIKHTLKMEEVNQVGSFVWSHLVNLYNSASPTRVEIQSLLTDRDLDNKFNSDVRKFSRNYENSFFSKEYNIGANYQTNLIFSPKSYVPRSFTFNVTTDLFGQSVNLFEITTRMEGLEYYAENLFGPNGVYNNEKVSNHLRTFLRYFRSASEKKNYWDGVNRLPNVIDNNFDHPKISFGYKIFGNELKFTTLDGDKQVMSALANFNLWQKMKEFLAMQEILYERTAMFLDSSYVVPTGSGLPIRLDMAGSMACNLKISKILDDARLSDREFQLTANIASSINIDMVGTMTVDAFYKSAGLKLRTNMYSSGTVQLHLNINNTRLVHVSLGLPNRKVDVLSLHSDVAFIKIKGAEIEEKPLGILIADENQKNLQHPVVIPKNIVSNTTCSWAALDRLIGLKMCTDYQFTNMTKDLKAPYFILSGLTLFKVSLIKADPTAKNYVLEYNWNKTQNHSTFKFMFDTPGSQVNREISATVDFDIINNNVTALIHSAGNSLIAKGTYKRSENETYMDIGFDINGTKHLDASVGYTRKKFTHGYTYHPKIHLTINNERVAAISGAIRNAQKNNISQFDIDLTFQTKRVWSKLVGYIVQRNISLAGDFQLDYQLQRMPKKETLHLEVSLSNRSSKTLTHKTAEMKLQSTAYPQLNTVINAWYQQALGHLELHAEVNSNPHLKDDRHKLTAQLIISYSKMYFQNQGTKVNALIAVTKPIQNLDLKMGINHYTLGAESKTSLLIGYAPGKEISLIVNIITPRDLLFSIEGHTNLTIPNFNSMLIGARIKERSRHEYELDFSGTWFSGHNMTARGTYSDRSSAAIINHHLKMILKSPSFVNSILLNCHLYQNHSDLRVNLYAEQLDYDKYAFVLNHTTLSTTNIMSYIEARYRSNVYSAMTNIDITREIRLELHLDKWRDVHLTLSGINEENRQELAAEIKWDANRDPALKLGTMLQLSREYLMDTTSPGIKRNTMITLTYPGRLITGSCDLVIRSPHSYLVDITVNWNPENIIKASINADYVVKVEPEMRTYVKLESQLLTPFEQWKKTALNMRYVQLSDRVLASSSVYWKDSQYAIAEFDASANEHEDLKEWMANCGFTSTLHSNFSWVTVNITHKMLRSQTVDTHMLIKYNPDKTIDARSIWHLDKESDNVFNLTGNLHLYSPLANYRKNELKCQLRLITNWRFFGAANLELDKRKYTGNLIGDLVLWKESKVEFNVTTPLEKFAFVRGRFGLSENNRHAVAEIITPNGPLGVEALCQLFTSAYDFNVKFMLATPIDLLQKALMVAKLNNREADFRIGYNNITAGFLGTWHYHNITDFDYSYIVLTPLEGLQECGVITKLIVVRTEAEDMLNVDTEFSLRLADNKLGIKVKGGPKPPPVKIPLKRGIISTTNDPDGDESTEEEEEEEEDEDGLYWRGEVQMWLIIIPDISGELDIDTEGDTYKILSTIQLPLGKIIIDDNFVMEDVFHIKNDLHIDLTFSNIKEITSFYIFQIDELDEQSTYFMEMGVNVRKNITWIETGFHGNYTYQIDTNNTKAHLVKFNIRTPLEFLKDLRTNAVVEIEGNLYRSTITIRGNQLIIDLSGNIKMEKALLDMMITGAIDSPILKIPITTIAAKKDFTGSRKQIKFNAGIKEPVSKYTSFEAVWQIDEHLIRASAKLESWIKALESLETDVLYSNAIRINNTAKLNVHVTHLGEQEYQLAGNLSNGKIDADLHTPLSQKPHFHFHGDLRQINESLYDVRGELKDQLQAKSYDVSSVIFVQNDTLTSIDVKAEPKSANIDQIIFRLKRKTYGLLLDVDGGSFNGTIDANILNNLNWDVRARADLKKADKVDIYQLNTFMNVQVNGNTTLYIHAETPWNDSRTVTVNGNMMVTNTSGDVRLNHRLNDDKCHADVQWKLIYMEDMLIKLVAGYDTADLGEKELSTYVFFKNIGRLYRAIDMGLNLDINRKMWEFGTNMTIGFRSKQNFDTVFVVKLPPPDNDDHRFLISYHTSKDMQDISYVVGYNAAQAKSNYASDGSVRMATRDINGHFRVTWGLLSTQSVNNLFNITFDNKEIELKYSLYTPKFLQEETLVFLFSYDGNSDERNLINADLFYPPRQQIGTARIFYESLINVNGTINASISTRNLAYVGCNFVVLTTLKQNKRFVEFFWPNNTASLNSDYNYYSERLDSNLDGVLHIEVPLNTRHVSHLTFGYKKRPQMTTGHSSLTYNNETVLHAQYNSKSESRAGFEKDRIQITVENIYKPIGIVYVNQYEYSGGNEGTNYPTVEFKQVNIYRLDNSSAFNIAGESRIRTTHTGQDIHLKAMHSNKTVQLKTDYQVLPGEFDQNTWLSLAEDAWVSYHINILNKTTEDMDNQYLILSCSYPLRNFTIDGSYKITSDEVSSEANLQWKRDEEKLRIVGAAFNWTNINSTSMEKQQQVELSLRHPTFEEKNVTLKGILMKRNHKDLLNAVFTANYSTNEDKLLTLSALLRDESDASSRKYFYKIVGKHVNTRLDLDVEGFVRRQGYMLLETENHARYTRSYVSNEAGELIGRIDRKSREIFFRRVNNEAVKYFAIGYYPSSSRYVINGSAINTPELNATGAFFLDPSEKLIWTMVNYTPDARVSFRMHGNIPDARNAIFNIWRTYDDDLTISDVSFYLKLNHSRLITSTLRWRPELKSDIVNTVKTTFNEMCESVNDDIDYWKQYIKTEVINAITDVWQDAEQDISGFLDDWYDLKNLEYDFEELQIYLNESYNANHFYIKDIVGIGIYVVDELSLRSHIQSLPNILNEIWEIMGGSGEALRNSLLWLIETIKNAYYKVSEIIAAVLRGDSVSQVANIIEKLIEKYDMFIKDLHVSFIKYMENLWNTIFSSISEQWHRFLKLMEPLFIRFIHYLETLSWKASREMLDFLYDRKKEIITSPYFDRFTNFTQDVDKVYRDIKANDIVTNVHKYSRLVIQFIKQRYFAFVPFGKELNDVTEEIVSELKELRKLPSVNYALDKLEQMYDKIGYLSEYFEVRVKIEGLIQLVHSKMMDIGQTALQAESQYREAKTMFIFDPNQGLMCLEQKLPMSWHAFNQTPEFHEIPEIRAIVDMKKYFVTSNTTFWSLYYQYKPYSELTNWLPPFKAQAMIIGSQHYITFDGRYFDFVGNCTYLLAKDFVHNTFAILVKYNTETEKITHQIIVLVGNNAIELDLFNDTMKLISQSEGTTTNLQLPIELDHGATYVYQVENVVTVERKHDQFRLECNLKFNLCTLELSGWYYGKTAGLFGTMNNEQFDDILGSNKLFLKDTGSLAHSWSINENCVDTTNRANKIQHLDNAIFKFCDELFVNKSSEFGICFGVIDPIMYARMCLNSFTEDEACTVAMSYMQRCMFHDTYLRIPDKCTTCTMIDGSQVAEGRFKRLEDDEVPRSVDVVFIVEAKSCNRNMTSNSSMELLITQLDKELNDLGLTENRWSLVIFGGDEVYDRPRSIILDGQIFTKNVARFTDYFNYVPVGNGNQDIFAAIGFASRLVFRAGVSKTFILMPCSHCEPENQTLEYSVLHQVLLEHDITLHILMDDDFQFEKEKIGKTFYGLDASKSYTRNDFKKLLGDEALRRQVKLSKNVLGYCTPLSLETNGTIFSGDKLRLEKSALIKKFVSVFAKRVALTAEPNKCQLCECTADNNGVTQMECMPCVYPMPVYVDYVSETFNLNESFSMMPSADSTHHSQIDPEDD
ncbi:apolipophorins isoform X2 [Nylanderia fulva]|uniref:apolipophorins isoform X2 n=1 Tax=Nylanderia fulva TaxID=613905 RepID=UPI0010FB486C|nr:apolipophorins isoform X2 [Nylanderia fulva]